MLVAEGVKVIASALDADADIEAIYASESLSGSEESRALLARARKLGVPIFVLAPGILERIADAQAPQPLLATVRVTTGELAELQAAETLFVLVDVRDPGNLGAILRVADATGIGAVICCTGCADWQNPKAVRASAGSCFSVRVIEGGEARAVLSALRERGFRTIGTQASGGSELAGFDFAGKSAIVFGNEASGLSGEITTLLDEAVTIPMMGSAQSLNVATAAAVIGFAHASRARATRGGAVR